MARPRLRTHDESDGPESVCAFCHHPIRHYPEVGWVDVTSVERGGLYDFCISEDGVHRPSPSSA
jgi:hypothetical protein